MTGRLHHWHDALRALGSLYPPPSELDGATRSAQEAHISWIYWEKPRQPTVQLQSVLEGLTLLALLARIDAHAWIQEIQTIWTSKIHEAEWLHEALDAQATGRDAQPFVVGINVVVAGNQDLLVLSDYSASRDGASSEFKEMYSSIASYGNNPSDVLRVPVRLELDLSPRDDSDVLTDRLRGIFDFLVTLQQTTAVQQSSSPTAHFEIVEIRHTTTLRVRVNARGLEYLIKIEKLGVRIRDLPGLDMDDAMEIASDVASRLQTLLHVHETSRLPGIQSVAVSDETPRHGYPALLSALQESQSVRIVDLQMYQDQSEMETELELDQRSYMWALIGYSLFSRHARHRIKKLVMSVDYFDEDDLMSVMEPLSSRFSTDLFLSSYRHGGSYFGRQETTVLASRFHLQRPPPKPDSDDEWDDDDDDDDDEDSWDEVDQGDGQGERQENHATDREESTVAPIQYIFESRTPLCVRVLDRWDGAEGNEWFTVLLPGRGPAWIHRDDILSGPTEQTTTEPSKRQQRRPGFEQIQIDSMSDDSMDHVASLIKMIGHATKEISVNEHIGDRGIDDWCVQVLTVCPHLEKLVIDDVCFDDIQSLIDCVVLNNRHLQKLDLGLVLTTAIDSVRAFFDALGDPRHPLTSHLHELRLVLVLENAESVELVESVVEMLHHNRILRNVSIRFQLEDGILSLKPTITAAVNCHTEELPVVAIRLQPLDVRSKLAFISAVHGESVATSSSCRSRLDSGVLAIIFQLAAPSCTRRVHLTVVERWRPAEVEEQEAGVVE